MSVKHCFRVKQCYRKIGPKSSLLHIFRSTEPFLTSFAPLIFAHGGLHFIGAMSFIILWCLIGWAALQVQMPKLFDFATTLIGLRILVGYLEVFGSLLLTGVGMITGGSFILFLTWLWFKKSPQLREYLKQKAG